MIYVDSSVVLASVFEEARRPDDRFWTGPRFASRLTDLEVRVRATKSSLGSDVAADVEQLLSQIRFVEITPATVHLLYTNPPSGVRTLDAIHLATLVHLRRSAHDILVATYDRRLASTAAAMGFGVIAP